MKYCTHCGTQLEDDALYCTACGCATGAQASQPAPATGAQTSKSDSTTVQTIIKVFMIIGCIASVYGLFIPLCWKIPMTIKYWRACEAKQPVSTAFKVCTLLFVNVIAGAVMLCEEEIKEEINLN